MCVHAFRKPAWTVQFVQTGFLSPSPFLYSAVSASASALVGGRREFCVVTPRPNQGIHPGIHLLHPLRRRGLEAFGGGYSGYGT